jgi:two-component system, NarL family, response regulator LiaR
MKRTIILYALALAALVFLLKMLEYKYLVRELKLEFYLGVIAVIFAALGVWAGLKLTRKTPVVVNSSTPFSPDENLIRQSGISKREYEVLELMAKGLSNQEIADQLFVSLNTVKTHTSNLFIKLDVKRRTQAIQKAKGMHLIG